MLRVPQQPTHTARGRSQRHSGSSKGGGDGRGKRHGCRQWGGREGQGVPIAKLQRVSRWGGVGTAGQRQQVAIGVPQLPSTHVKCMFLQQCC